MQVLISILMLILCFWLQGLFLLLSQIFKFNQLLKYNTLRVSSKSQYLQPMLSFPNYNHETSKDSISGNASEQAHKSQKFRQQIRTKQIQEYKKKVRSNFIKFQALSINQPEQSNSSIETSPEFGQKNYYVSNENHWKADQYNEGKWQSGCWIETKPNQNRIGKPNKQTQHFVASIQKQLLHIQQNLQMLLQQWSDLNAQPACQNNSQQSKKQEKSLQIHFEMDRLINLLIQIQEKCEEGKGKGTGTGGDKGKQFGIFIALMTSVLRTITKTAVLYSNFSSQQQMYNLLKQSIEQRCLISDYFKKYVSMWIRHCFKGNQFTVNIQPIDNINKQIGEITVIVEYLSCLLGLNSTNNSKHSNRNQDRSRSRSRNKIKNPCNPPPILDFTETQQQILYQLTPILNQLNYNISQLSTKDEDGKYQDNYEDCLLQIAASMNKLNDKIVTVYAWYLRMFLREVKFYGQFGMGQNRKSEAENENGNGMQIGSMSIQAVKSTIMISMQSLRMYMHQSDCSRLPQEQILPIMKTTVNNCIDCCSTLIKLISASPNSPIGNYQQQQQQQQLIGLAEILMQIIGEIVSVREMAIWQVHQNGEDNWNGGMWAQWFTTIRNIDIVEGLHMVLETRTWDTIWVRKLVECNPLEIYLLTCIFTQLTSLGLNASYTETRQSLSKFSQKTQLELSCLKLICLLVKKYGVVVDNQQNLAIRYIQKIGDGRPNQYYYKQQLSKNSKIFSKQFLRFESIENQ